MAALAGIVLEEEVSRTGGCNAGILMENQRVVAFQTVGRKRAIAVKTAWVTRNTDVGRREVIASRTFRGTNRKGRCEEKAIRAGGTLSSRGACNAWEAAL